MNPDVGLYKSEIDKLPEAEKETLKVYLIELDDRGLEPSDFGQDNWSELIKTLVEYLKKGKGKDELVVQDFNMWLK